MNQSNPNTAAATTPSSSASQGSSAGTRQPNPGQILEMEMERSPRPFANRPVIALSVRLIDSYREINRIYYEARSRRNVDQPRTGTYNDGYDDENFDYIVRENELFASRYTLRKRIGKGSFGQVVSAYDNEGGCDVAIKIIKSKRPFFTQAQTEKQLLQLVTNSRGSREANLVELFDHFVYRNHQCLVFEMLSYNLYELLKNTRFLGVSLNLIRKFARQILQSLQFLARPDVDIVHCDLKPENILLRHPRRSSLKLIDFGSSCLRTRTMYTYIQSRFYRSPEVFLGLKYDQKIDIWSLGCVLVEMHTGEPLFGGLDQVDQFCRIIDVLGPPPAAMLERSPPRFLEKFYDKVHLKPLNYDNEGGSLYDLEGTLSELPADVDRDALVHSTDGKSIFVLKRPQGRDQPPKRRLSDIIGVFTQGPNGRRRGERGHSEADYVLFAQFVEIMLEYEPEGRVSAREASEHAYLSVSTLGPGEGNSPGDSQTSTTTSEAATERGENNDGVHRSGGGARKPRLRSSSAPSVAGNNSKSNSGAEGSDETAQESNPGLPQRHQSDSAFVDTDSTSNCHSPESASKQVFVASSKIPVASASKDGAAVETFIAKTTQSPSSPLVKI